MKKLQPLVTWSIKHHWIFLVIILGTQWLTGQYMHLSLARQIHKFLSTVIIISTIGLALDKLYLYLKSKGKI